MDEPNGAADRAKATAEGVSTPTGPMTEAAVTPERRAQDVLVTSPAVVAPPAVPPGEGASTRAPVGIASLVKPNGTAAVVLSPKPTWVRSLGRIVATDAAAGAAMPPPSPAPAKYLSNRRTPRRVASARRLFGGRCEVHGSGGGGRASAPRLARHVSWPAARVHQRQPAGHGAPTGGAGAAGMPTMTPPPPGSARTAMGTPGTPATGFASSPFATPSGTGGVTASAIQTQLFTRIGAVSHGIVQSIQACVSSDTEAYKWRSFLGHMERGRAAAALKCVADKAALLSARFVPGFHSKLETILMGATPCHIAAYYNDVALLRGLLEAGADATAVDIAGRTPLHIAAMCLRKEACEVLLGAVSPRPVGEDAPVDVLGMTPAACAGNRWSAALVNFMVLKGFAPKSDADYRKLSRNDKKEFVRKLASSKRREVFALLHARGDPTMTPRVVRRAGAIGAKPHALQDAFSTPPPGAPSNASRRLFAGAGAGAGAGVGATEVAGSGTPMSTASATSVPSGGSPSYHLSMAAAQLERQLSANTATTDGGEQSPQAQLHSPTASTFAGDESGAAVAVLAPHVAPAVTVQRVQGMNSYQEDRYVIEASMPGFPACSLFAVLDGHGGDACAELASQQLVHCIRQVVTARGEGESGAPGGTDASDCAARIASVLSAAVLLLESRLREEMTAVAGEGEVVRDTSGTTLCAVVVTPDAFVTANVGDSRAVVGVAGGDAVALSVDHTAADEEEKRRVLSAGGTIEAGRVVGKTSGDTMAMTRSLGDFEFKPRLDDEDTKDEDNEGDGNEAREGAGDDSADVGAVDGAGPDAAQGAGQTGEPSTPAGDGAGNQSVYRRAVIADPTVTVVARTAKQDAVVVACDGVWDVLSNDKAVDVARKAFSSGSNAAEEVVAAAVDAYSHDNITAIVVQL